MSILELAGEVAKVVGDRKQARAAVDSVFSSIIEALKNREEVRLTGFGTFKVSRRKARIGKNPRTGESIRIDERMVPKFIPAKALKEAVHDAD